MARNYQTKANVGALPDTITATRFGAGEFNSIAVELENAVTTSDQTLAPEDGTGEVTDQLAMALAIYGAGGAFYHADTGAVNAYVLTPISPKESPPAYFDGFTVIFEPATPNTTASTVNVASLGVKNITYSDGNALAGGELVGSCIIKYNLSDDRFELLLASGNLSNIGFEYIIDSTQTDQGAASTNSDTLTIFDVAAIVGTTKYATVRLPHNPASGNVTNYIFDTSLDLSAYPNLYFVIDKGARFSRTTGDELFTIHSPENYILQPDQQITSVHMLRFTRAGVVWAEWWGAIADGVTDCTLTIQYAFDANTGGITKGLPGSYLTDGGYNMNTGTIFEGSGLRSTTILVNSATPGDGLNPAVFVCWGLGAGLRNLRIISNVAQTGNSYVVLSGEDSFLENFYMDGDFNGVRMNGTACRVRHGRFLNGVANSIRILVDGGDTSPLIEDVLMGADPSNIAQAGIKVTKNSALIISNVSVIRQSIGLYLDVDDSGGGFIASVYVNNCFFDNGTYGIVISSTNTGSVVRCRFDNCWTSSNANEGVLISNTGSSSVEGMYFHGLHSFLNTGSGISTAGVVEDIAVLHSVLSENSYGMFVNVGFDKLRILGCDIGAAAGLSGNTNYGLNFPAGMTNTIITNNIFDGNGIGPINNLSGIQGIYYNLGLITENSGTSASIATGGTIAHGLITTPTVVNLTSTDAGVTGIYWTSDATNITVNYTGGGSHAFHWEAKVR